jgi:hypothetical protein
MIGFVIELTRKIASLRSGSWPPPYVTLRAYCAAPRGVWSRVVGGASRSMASGCLLVIIGGVLGTLLALFGTVPAMMLAGGGQSHNDMFILMQSMFGGACLGAVAGPSLIRAFLGARERRRVDRAKGATPASFFQPIAALVAAFAAAFGAFSALYHSLYIASLSPDRGGPRAKFDPALRTTLALLLGLALAIAAPILYVRAVRSLRRRAGRVP